MPQTPCRRPALIFLLAVLLSHTWLNPSVHGQGTAPDAPSAKLDRVKIEGEVRALMINLWGDRFEHVEYPRQWLDHVIEVMPGESLQNAIDQAHAAGGGVVRLAAGEYFIDDTIHLKSNVTLLGRGQDKTILKQGKISDGVALSATPDASVKDVVFRHLTIDGTREGKVNGLLMSGRNEDRHARIMLQHVTLTNWSAQGVHMKRTDHIVMDRCTFQYNGAANGLYHNVYFLYNKHILQSDCDMSYPVLGKGNKYTSVMHLLAQRCTIKGPLLGNGIQADNNEAGYLFFHKYHISGAKRVAMWFPCEDFYDKFTYTEDPTYAPQHVVVNRCEIVNNNWGAMWRSVHGGHILNSTFDNQRFDVGLLKCQVRFRGNTIKAIETYNDVEQWPDEVDLLW